MKKNLFITCTILFLISNVSWGQTILSSGDLAIIGMDTPSEDFMFVTFTNMEAGTEIYFTDEEADGDSTIGTGEGTVLYTAPLGGISAGTVITYTDHSSDFTTTSDGNLTLADSGDGILAYTGTSVGNVATFLHAIGKDLSVIGTFPGGFTNYVVIGSDDGEYSGTRTGSANNLLGQINNASNWTTSGSGVIPFDVSSFTVGSLPPSVTVSTASLMNFSYAINNGPSASQSFTVNGADLTNNIVVSPPANYEISTDDATFQSTALTLTQSDGTVAQTNIYTRLIQGLSAANYNEEISISSTGANSKTVSCSGTVFGIPTIIISEVTHPSNAASAKFVEIYNYGPSEIDLTTTELTLVMQVNGGSFSNIPLTGTLASKSTYVVAYSTPYYLDYFDQPANHYSGSLTGNGNDGYFLFFGGNQSTGTLFDAYGVLDEDGTGQAWNYEDSKAVRKTTVSAPNTTWTASEWNIFNATTSRMSPGSYPASVWNGTTDGTWATSSNWDNGLPGSLMDAYIWDGASNFPDVTSAVTMNNLCLQHNAQINGQENITVSGTTTVIHEITESTSSSALDHWQYFTSPFTGSTSADLLSNNVRIDLYMAAYDNRISAEINDAWTFITSSSSSLLAGKGYAVTFVDDVSEESGTNIGADYHMRFSGTLINTLPNASANLRYQGSDMNNWNLIGNPYLAPIDWSNATIQHSNVQGGCAQIYNPATGSYTAINSDGTTNPSGGSKYIPPMQGFFVEALIGGDFDLPLNATVNTAQDFYKSKPVSPVLRIQVALDSLTDETVVFFNEMAQEGFDPFDAHKLLARSLTPQIYTSTTDGHALVFNQTNSLENNIMLNIETKQAGRYVIRLMEKLDQFNDYRIRLIDLDKNLIDLDHSDFSFDAPEGLNSYQFQLSFEMATHHSILTCPQIWVYSSNKTIVVKSIVDIDGEINVFNLSGKKIFQGKMIGKEGFAKCPNESGIYIVRLINKNEITHYKVNIN
ncbi:MAG: hypothetical protein ACERKD_08055 [Prolixibacteraceae bacterium]